MQVGIRVSWIDLTIENLPKVKPIVAQGPMTHIRGLGANFLEQRLVIAILEVN